MLEYLSDVDTQGLLGMDRKSVEIMQTDLEKNQEEIRSTFDNAVQNYSAKIDREMITEV